MKTVLASLILMFCAVSTFATAQAFIAINEGVKSLNSLEQNKSDSSVIGHRINGQGQFVLVYSK